MRRLRATIRVDVMQKISFVAPHGHTTNSACSSSDPPAISCITPMHPIDHPTLPRSHLTFGASGMLVRVLEVTPSASVIKFEQTFGGCLGHGQGAYLCNTINVGTFRSSSLFTPITVPRVGRPSNFLAACMICICIPFSPRSVQMCLPVLISWNDADLSRIHVWLAMWLEVMPGQVNHVRCNRLNLSWAVRWSALP